MDNVTGKPMKDKQGKAKRKQPKELGAGYQPSKAELEADVSIDATPEELAQAVAGHHPDRPHTCTPKR